MRAFALVEGLCLCVFLLIARDCSVRTTSLRRFLVVYNNLACALLHKLLVSFCCSANIWWVTLYFAHKSSSHHLSAACFCRVPLFARYQRRCLPVPMLRFYHSGFFPGCLWMIRSNGPIIKCSTYLNIFCLSFYSYAWLQLSSLLSI